MLKQTAAVTSMNLRSIPLRLGTSWVIVIGIAVTVSVLASVMAMSVGFKKTLSATGRPDRAIVLRGGSNAELSSTISRDNTLTIMDAPGVKKDADGKPVASAEMVAVVALPLRATGTAANVTLRGVGPKAFELRPEIHLVAGRMFQPAVRELIVGKSAVTQFKNTEIGSHIAFRNSEWTVVGEFESNADAHESEMIGDIETVLSAFRRNLFQSVTLLLDSPESFSQFKDKLTTDPTLTVDVKREPEYYADQSKQLNTLLNFLAYFVGGFMAIGAVFGALNTMYSAVSARAVEIATLRAIGFGSTPIVVSVIIEALLLSLIGGAIGAIAAWMFFNGNTVNTLGANFTQVVFHLTVTPDLLEQSIIGALVIGFLGSLAPAVQLAGPFLWRYLATLCVVAPVLAIFAGAASAHGNFVKGAFVAVALTLVWLLAIAVGYFSLRAIAKRRSNGGMNGWLARLAVSLAVVVLSLPFMPLSWGILAYHLKALWTTEPAGLTGDSVVQGLRAT